MTMMRTTLTGSWLQAAAFAAGSPGAASGGWRAAEAAGRDLEGVTVVEPVPLGDAAAFLPALDHGAEASAFGHGIASGLGGFADLAGHLLDVPAAGLALLAQPVAAGAGLGSRHRRQCLAVSAGVQPGEGGDQIR